MPKSIISKYLHTPRGKIRGLILASKFMYQDCNYIGIGYSLCNDKDAFNKKTAMTIAMGRAFVHATRGKLAVIPRSIQQEYAIMRDRAFKYFKDADFYEG